MSPFLPALNISNVTFGQRLGFKKNHDMKAPASFKFTINVWPGIMIYQHTMFNSYHFHRDAEIMRQKQEKKDKEGGASGGSGGNSGATGGASSK